MCQCLFALLVLKRLEVWGTFRLACSSVVLLVAAYDSVLYFAAISVSFEVVRHYELIQKQCILLARILSRLLC